MNSHATAAGVLVAVGGLCSSCIFLGDPAEPAVAATLIEGQPALVVALCEGEGVESVYITDSTSQDGEGPILWRIDTVDAPVVQESFIVGEVPEGFSGSVPLDANALKSEMTAWVVSDLVESLGAIDFSQVEDDELYVDLEQVSAKDLREDSGC